MPLITSTDFASTKSLDVGTVIDQLKSLKVHREVVLSQDTKAKTNKLMVFQEEATGPRSLGLISDTRPPQAHHELVSWFTEQLNASRVEWKLRTHFLDEKSLDLYQEYVFNRDVKTPDGEPINPMFILRSSLIRSPFELTSGTLRHVCSNGITVGRIAGKIKFGSKELLTRYAQMPLSNQLGQMLSRFDKVGSFYESLGAKELDEDWKMVFADVRLPTGLKKALLEALEADGKIEVNLGYDPKGEKTPAQSVKKEFWEPSSVKAGIILKDSTEDLWSLYNRMTNWATNFPRNEQARMTTYRKVDEVFTSKFVFPRQEEEVA